MDLFQQKRGVELLYNLFLRDKSDVLPISYIPSKTKTLAPVEDHFPRATPESCGIESTHLLRMLQELEDNQQVNLHAITVLCDGAVISEASRIPYDRRVPHVTHSLCKSITGMAIGLLRDEGRIDLDEPAYRYLRPDDLPGRLSGKMKAVTVRHLLTMSSGVTFAETGSATEKDWVKAFFSSDQKFEPGSSFAYNSMNTYILSAIVKAVTGMGLCAYLYPRLFRPLHITQYFWETCPRGIEKGGWGLYIAQEDVAKIALLYLHDGVFEGKQIISKKWVSEACRPAHVTPESTGRYDYGFQLWCTKERDAFLFNGMLGQNAWIHPRNRIIVITNSGNNEFFQTGDMLAIIEKALGQGYRRAPKPLKANHAALRQLRLKEETFFSARAWIKRLPVPGRFTQLWRRLTKKALMPLPSEVDSLTAGPYLFRQNNSGILPLFVRLQQNNHTKGLQKLTFDRQGERFFACFDEGEGELYRVELGFYDYRPTLLTIGSEEYRLACAASFVTDEEGRDILMMHMVFPELAHERRVKFYYRGTPPCLRLREVPGKEVITSLSPIISKEQPGLVGVVLGRLNLDYFTMKMWDKFEPLLVCEVGAPPLSSTKQQLSSAAKKKP